RGASSMWAGRARGLSSRIRLRQACWITTWLQPALIHSSTMALKMPAVPIICGSRCEAIMARTERSMLAHARAAPSCGLIPIAGYSGSQAPGQRREAGLWLRARVGLNRGYANSPRNVHSPDEWKCRLAAHIYSVVKKSVKITSYPDRVKHKHRFWRKEIWGAAP